LGFKKTKERIQEASLALFNQSGWVNITLRDVSARLNISYGNVTYHYGSKEKLLEELYANYQQAFVALSTQLTSQSDLFMQVLAAPRGTFALSMKYRFLFVDFLELQRQYPAFMEEVNTSHALRKQGWKLQLLRLQTEGILRDELEDNTFDFIMELSGMVRTFFFLKVTDAHADLMTLEATYVHQVNAIIWPYLTPTGLAMARAAGYFTN
jgi:AcrR family transcriptional regulator